MSVIWQQEMHPSCGPFRARRVNIWREWDLHYPLNRWVMEGRYYERLGAQIHIAASGVCFCTGRKKEIERLVEVHNDAYAMYCMTEAP